MALRAASFSRRFCFLRLTAEGAGGWAALLLGGIVVGAGPLLPWAMVWSGVVLGVI